MNAAEIARNLHGRKMPSGWMARCPAHDDHDPSLSLKDADNGRILVKCHAGCPQAAVVGRRVLAIVRALLGKAARIIVWDPEDGKDISEWFERGHSETELIAQVEYAEVRQ